MNENNPYKSIKCDTFTVLEVKMDYVLYTNGKDTMSDSEEWLEVIVDRKL